MSCSCSCSCPSTRTWRCSRIFRCMLIFLCKCSCPCSFSCSCSCSCSWLFSYCYSHVHVCENANLQCFHVHLCLFSHPCCKKMGMKADMDMAMDMTRHGMEINIACSETTPTGESRYHTSPHRGFEPVILVAGSKQVSPLDQWVMVRIVWDCRLSICETGILLLALFCYML